MSGCRVNSLLSRHEFLINNSVNFYVPQIPKTMNNALDVLSLVECKLPTATLRDEGNGEGMGTLCIGG